MKPIALEDFCNFTFLANVTFSPEGGSACFGVTRIQKEKNSYASCLYVYRQGKTAQLTAGGKELRFQYLDEDTILFQGNREEEKDKEDISSRFYKISLLGGEASLAFTLPIPVQQVWPLKNGDYLALGSVTPGFEKLYTGEEKVRKAFDEEERRILTKVLNEGVEKGRFRIENVTLMADIIHYSVKGLEVPYIYDRLGEGLSEDETYPIVKGIVLRVLNMPPAVK